jgi:hypothetical protein
MATLTPTILRRIQQKRFGLSDPCIICGVPFRDCPHDNWTDTKPLIDAARKLTRAERERMLKADA